MWCIQTWAARSRASSHEQIFFADRLPFITVSLLTLVLLVVALPLLLIIVHGHLKNAIMTIMGPDVLG